MSELSAISAIRRQVRELVDGTLEIKLHVEPRDKKSFLALFPDIDMPVALAPLVANFEQIKPVDDKPLADLVPFVDKPKGGELAKWAGILSNDPVFWEWLNTLEYQNINSEALAAEYIRDWCQVSSRAELDHNPEAAKIFREMMGEFDDWKNGGKAA